MSVAHQRHRSATRIYNVMECIKRSRTMPTVNSPNMNSHSCVLRPGASAPHRRTHCVCVCVCDANEKPIKHSCTSFTLIRFVFSTPLLFFFDPVSRGPGGPIVLFLVSLRRWRMVTMLQIRTLQCAASRFGFGNVRRRACLRRISWYLFTII